MDVAAASRTSNAAANPRHRPSCRWPTPKQSFEQYAPAPQPEVQHEVAEAAAEVVAEEGNAKRGSRRNGRGGRKNGDGAREARAEVVEVDVAPVVEAMP